MHIAEQIEALNPQPGEHFSANYILGSQDMVSVVLTPDLIPSYVESLPPTADIWIGVNPVDHTKIPPGKRGLACDVTRLAALFADLDVKDGACANLGVAEDIIDDLSGLIGETPTYMVYTGHGIHPVWAVDPDTTRPNADLAALLKRWGQLVKLVAKRRGAHADSVFDLARILRAAGTRNNKDDVPIDVAGVMGTGGPLTLDQIDERLTEQGIVMAPPVDPADNVSVTDAGWAHTECHYCTKAFEAWATEVPSERHPRLINWFTRLESMRRLGCLTYSQYQRGAKIAADRFTVLCEQGIGGKPRAVKPFEIEDCLDWGATRAAAKGAAELALEVGKHQHDILGGIVNPDAPQTITAPVVHIVDEVGEDEKPDLFRHIFAAEDDFWSATASLKQIYETSMARLVSPWAVLAYCAARILYLVPPSVELPNLIGRGSLNWFGVVVDKSGGGKSAAASVAKELVAPMFPTKIKESGIGSGEGMVTQFFDPPVPPDKKPRRRDAVMFTIDEVDTMTAMSQRQGGTTLSIARSAFSGGTLGFSYATRGRDVHVEEHTYRLTLVMNAQPARLGALLGDHGGGTPQRFMWFPANDLRFTDEGADETLVPAAIPLPHGLALLGRKIVQIPTEARDLIRSNRVKQGRGETENVLNSHGLFCREKFAYALALLDGRVDMGAEDWRLSGIAAEVSSRTRDWAQAELQKSLEVEAQEEGRRRGIGYAAADDEKSHQQAKRTRRIQDWVLARLRDKGPLSEGDLRKAAPSRDRPFIKGTCDSLMADGLITPSDDGKRWATA